MHTSATYFIIDFFSLLSHSFASLPARRRRRNELIYDLFYMAPIKIKRGEANVLLSPRLAVCLCV